MTDFKLCFVDKAGNLVKAEISLEEKEKGLCFSMSGDYKGGFGQVFDKVKPRTQAQRDLIGLWRKYHLNDMNAGTEEQEEALKDFKENDYTKRCDYLKSKGLYEVKLPNGKSYKYGSAWLYRALPNDIKEQVKRLIEQIKREEEVFKEEKIKESEVKSWEDLGDDKIQALGQFLGITPQEAEDIQDEGNNRYSYEGIEYFIGTEEETEEEAKAYLIDDNSLWIESVKAGHTQKGLEEWAEEVINIDGYGHILNHYDGSEDSEEVKGENYYIIRTG